MKVAIGQVVENRLSNGEYIRVRVLELNVAGTEMARVTDARETLPTKTLIKRNRTWAAPLENLFENGSTAKLWESMAFARQLRGIKERS